MIDESKKDNPLKEWVSNTNSLDLSKAWTAPLLCLRQGFERSGLSTQILKKFPQVINDGFIVFTANKSNKLANRFYSTLPSTKRVHPSNIEDPGYCFYLFSNRN